MATSYVVAIHDLANHCCQELLTTDSEDEAMELSARLHRIMGHDRNYFIEVSASTYEVGE